MHTQNIYDLVDTWNASGTTFTAVKMNVTDTASAAASLLMDLQVGGTSIFAVRRASFSGTKYNRAVVVLPQYSYSSIQTGGFFTIGVDESTPNIALNSASGGGIDFVAGSPLRWRDSTTNATGGVADLILTRRDAANLRLGAADAAAPVAQTLLVQSVVAGTTNTAGANLTITGSQGTGTGAGGSIVFQVAPAGSSGTAQNALVDALTISSTREVTFAGNMNMRNGANAQTFRVYNTTDGTNSEFGKIAWSSNVLQIGTEKAGTGAARTMVLQTDGTTRVTLNNSAVIEFTYSQFNLGGGARIHAISNGVLGISNSSNADGSFVFGATASNTKSRLTSSGTTLQVRLGDDSAFASIQGKLTTETAYTAGAPTATGYLVLYDSTGTAYRVPAVLN